VNKKNSKKLMIDFPFLRPQGGLGQSLMYFGFDVDDGWFKLIYQLCKDIQRVIDNTPDEALKDFQVVQVKEKFGSLRFYCGAATSEIHDLIQEAEAKSSRVCELCGKRGSMSVSNSGWYKTLCPYHRWTRKYRKTKPWRKRK